MTGHDFKMIKELLKERNKLLVQLGQLTDRSIAKKMEVTVAEVKAVSKTLH